MPISSGAKGHAGVGVDTSIKWFPEGGKKLYKPLTIKVNSYLQRYLDCHPEVKKRCLAELSGKFPDIGRKIHPAQRKLNFPKEKCIVDGNPMEKGQQDAVLPPNRNGSTVQATDSMRLADAKIENKDSRHKAAASKSSLCTLL
uniref:Uncharacterized protein n=1 Tax=Sphaerodactylus townsendi TaxID=933632 RepID=A0ACB8ESX2_9SAUR